MTEVYGIYHDATSMWEHRSRSINNGKKEKPVCCDQEMGILKENSVDTIQGKAHCPVIEAVQGTGIKSRRIGRAVPPTRWKRSITYNG